MSAIDGFRRRKSTADALEAQEGNNAPMLAIFGVTFALLLVFLLIINVMSDAALRERIDQYSEGEGYRINWAEGSEGYVVISFPDHLRIVETGAGLSAGGICAPESPFREYVREVYNARKQRIIFVLLEKSVSIMAEARECIRGILPNRAINISWIMADNELLKSVQLDDIPPYIENYVEKQ